MSTTTGIIQQASNPNIWLPTDLGNNLLAWYDAEDVSTIHFSSGTNVSSWDDKSGNDFYNSVPGGWGAPTFPSSAVFNGKPGIRFNSSSTPRRTLQTDLNLPLSGNDPWTLVTVARNGNIDHSYVSIGDPSQDTSNLNGFGTFSNNDTTFGFGNSSGYTPLISSNTNVICLVEFDGTNNPVQFGPNSIGSGVTLYFNDIGYQFIESQSENMSLTSNKLRIGNINGSTPRGSDVIIAEVVIVDRVLTSTEKASLYTYLNNKWDIF